MKAGIFSRARAFYISSVILTVTTVAWSCTGAYNKVPVRDEANSIPILYLEQSKESAEGVATPVEWDAELCKVQDNAIVRHPIDIAKETVQILDRKNGPHSRVLVRYGTLVFGDKTVAGIPCILLKQMD